MELDPFEKILFSFTGFVLTLLLIYGGRALYVQAECLGAGYPKSDITWKLDGYCLNIDGVVRGTVNELSSVREE